MKYQIYRFGGVTGNSSQLSTTGYAYMIEDMTADIPVSHFLGKYTSLAALESAHPTAIAGDYAQVDTGAGSDVVNYSYDTEDGWIEGGSGSGATDTDMLPEGSTNLYYTDARAIAANAAAIANKLDKPTVSTGTTILFDKPRVYGALNSSHTFDTFSTAGAVAFSEATIFFNGATLPAILTSGNPNYKRIGGSFVPSVMNIIEVTVLPVGFGWQWVYTIRQENPETPITLTYASTLTLDMSLRAPRLLTLGGNITFNTPTNITPGAEISMVITGGAADYTVTFPAFKWLGGAPPTVPAGKELVIWLFSKSTTVGSIIAAYTLES